MYAAGVPPMLETARSAWELAQGVADQELSFMAMRRVVTLALVSSSFLSTCGAHQVRPLQRISDRSTRNHRLGRTGPDGPG